MGNYFYSQKEVSIISYNIKFVEQIKNGISKKYSEKMKIKFYISKMVIKNDNFIFNFDYSEIKSVLGEKKYVSFETHQKDKYMFLLEDNIDFNNINYYFNKLCKF